MLAKLKVQVQKSQSKSALRIGSITTTSCGFLPILINGNFSLIPGLNYQPLVMISLLWRVGFEFLK
jgi:hypothetical protein